MRSDTTTRVREFVRRRGVVRPRDVEEAGYPRALVYRLRDRGELEQIGRGLFRHPEAELTEKHMYAEAAKAVPGGVVCLISSLAFHGVGTQNPARIWLALERGSQRPTAVDLPLEFAWFSGEAFTAGVEVHDVEGVTVRVYSPAKTVADLFKYRNKLGVDVAIEALEDGWRRRLFTVDELMRYAAVCRVERVIRPYVQAITA